ncbi:MAG: prolipoprotein diacylglyceryl transferase [Chthonomonadales bacterium]|nr:prolipoprotein diacylglyceryl transferase [Chthonomonadales bacterium]
MNLSPLCYRLGYLTGLGAFWLMARQRGLATQGVFALLMAGLVGGLACANIAQWIFAGTAGKTVLGAVAGGYLCVALYKRYLGIRRPLGDLFAVALSAGEAVGRWGCFFAGCCYGRTCTHLPWAIWQHDAWRHPTQAYLSLASLGILMVLLCVERLRPPENTLFFLQGLLYCGARFGIEFLRDSPRTALNLSLAQWACLVGGLFFATRLTLLLHSTRRSYTHATA